MNNGKVLHLVQVIARWILGAVFTFSGVVKLIDPLGTAYKIADYLAAFQLLELNTLPLIPLTLSILLSSAELVLGLCLWIRIKPRTIIGGVNAFMLIMTPLTLYIALNNPVSDCGCFGDAIVISNWATFYKNIVLWLLSLVLLITRRRLFSLLLPRIEWCAITCIMLGAVAFAGYNLYWLPILDFRPYKVGANIKELIKIPADAPRDVYETTFVYAQNGIEQEFTLNNFPHSDSTWVFVRQNTTLVSKGYEPPMKDFFIYTQELEDITHDILNNEGYTVLALMYNLEMADIDQAIKLNTFYDEAMNKGVDFYAVTASGNKEIDQFINTTGANYPFCTADPIMLKTVIRANPGIVVLKNGVIVDKWTVRAL